jgi:hypothetical protein
MRWLAGYLLVVVAAVAAPLGVQVQSEKDSYLVYESIPVTVSIHNYSGRTVQLNETARASWLDFIVVGEGNSFVRKLRQPQAGAAVLIAPGETVSRTVDLLPLYELRNRGTFRIQAVVQGEAGRFESPPIRFSLIHGRELWSQVVGLSGTEEYRTYALLARRGERDDRLYVSVRDEPNDVAYGLVPLGTFLSTTPPQARVDRSGTLHVLFQNGPRSHGYVAIDPSARPVARAGYSDFTSHPRLVVADGTVSVTGGEQTYPRVERLLTEEELNPPPPPPPKKPKRHWWWPFGARS